MDPSLYAAIRFDIAALALLPRTFGNWNDKRFIAIAATIGLFKFLGYYGQSIGLVTSTADKSAFICSLNAVWVALITFVKDREFRLQTWISVVIAVLGVSLLELKGSTVPVIGDLWLLLQPIGFGTGYFMIENIMQNDETPRAGALSAFALLSVGIASTLWAISCGHTTADLQQVIDSPVATGGLLYTALFTTAGMIWLQSRSMKNVGATDASIILSSEPVWAAIFAAGLLGETFSQSDFVGGAMIIFACLSNELNLVERLFPQLAPKPVATGDAGRDKNCSN